MGLLLFLGKKRKCFIWRRSDFGADDDGSKKLLVLEVRYVGLGRFFYNSLISKFRVRQPIS